jgi:2-dehydro-3-deoxyphosphogluconate aldolase/(4S)-4-hydroxy-2-oxoglutarate aldolase
MAQFTKLQTLTAIRDTGIVPVFYNGNPEVAKNAVKACYEGGIRAFEFTNRGDFAHEIFATLVKFAKKECPGMILGAGTIIDAPAASIYIQSGANFIVGPLLNPDIAKLCNRRGIPYTPGCSTVSEIGFAQELGCDLCKVFPAGSVGGPSFIKNILGPLPWTMTLATGGVDTSEENLCSWGKSGVTCVGIGSKLFKKEIIEAGNWSEISDTCRSSLKYFAKGQNR